VRAFGLISEKSDIRLLSYFLIYSLSPTHKRRRRLDFMTHFQHHFPSLDSSSFPSLFIQDSYLPCVSKGRGRKALGKGWKETVERCSPNPRSCITILKTESFTSPTAQRLPLSLTLQKCTPHCPFLLNNAEGNSSWSSILSPLTLHNNFPTDDMARMKGIQQE